MKVYYDLHIHTALSPCADQEMTPNNIVNMAILNEMDCIAITDHNSCKNVKAVMEVAEETGILVIPGMELETSEEIHAVCLFPDLESSLDFDKLVESNINKISNKPKVFGNQFMLDKNDVIVSEYENLLLNASNISFDKAITLMKDYGGVIFPAHVDRHSYSILSNLGFIPKEMDISAVEFSKYTDAETYIKEHKRLFSKEYLIIQSSDAHNLVDMQERNRCFEFSKGAAIKDIIDFIGKKT